MPAPDNYEKVTEKKTGIHQHEWANQRTNRTVTVAKFDDGYAVVLKDPLGDIRNIETGISSRKRAREEAVDWMVMHPQADKVDVFIQDRVATDSRPPEGARYVMTKAYPDGSVQDKVYADDSEEILEAARNRGYYAEKTSKGWNLIEEVE